MTKKSVTVDRPRRSRITTSSAFLDKARLAASLASFRDVKEVFSLMTASPFCQVAKIDISRPSAKSQIHHMTRVDIFTCYQQSDPPHSLSRQAEYGTAPQSSRRVTSSEYKISLPPAARTLLFTDARDLDRVTRPLNQYISALGTIAGGSVL